MSSNTNKNLHYGEAYHFLENSTKIEIDDSEIISDNDYSKQYLKRLLEDIQGNILKSHGRTYYIYLFLRFDSDRKEFTKNWIGSFAEKYVVSAAKQQKQTQAYKKALENKTALPNNLFVNLSLSFKGYEALGFNAEENFKKTRSQNINGSEVNFNTKSFQKGMFKSLDNPPEDKNEWEPAYLQEIHGLILLADSDPSYLQSELSKVIEELKINNIEIIKQEIGLVRKNNKDRTVEPFGFEDGISQPLFLKTDIDKLTGTDKWDPSANLRLVLNVDPFGQQFDENTSDPYSFGSYLVYQKLEQNVTAFNDKITDLARTLENQAKDCQPKEETEQLVRAFTMGRFREDGRPVAEYGSLSSSPESEVVCNNFNYEEDGFSDESRWRCPFHAHIRKVNPRAINNNVYSLEQYDDSPENQRKRRIVRRGTSYGAPNEKHMSLLSVSTQANLVHYKNLLETLGEKMEVGKEGLLFVCFQSDIRSQFEKLRGYANDKDLGPNKTGNAGADPVAGKRTLYTSEWPRQTWPRKWGDSTNPVEEQEFDGFSEVVTPRGGEYFFTPSLSFLKSLQEV